MDEGFHCRDVVGVYLNASVLCSSHVNLGNWSDIVGLCVRSFFEQVSTQFSVAVLGYLERTEVVTARYIWSWGRFKIGELLRYSFTPLELFYTPPPPLREYFTVSFIHSFGVKQTRSHMKSREDPQNNDNSLVSFCNCWSKFLESSFERPFDNYLLRSVVYMMPRCIKLWTDRAAAASVSGRGSVTITIGIHCDAPLTLQNRPLPISKRQGERHHLQ